MGKRNRNVNKFAQRKRERREQEKNPQEKPAGDTRKNYEEIVRENGAFDQYYKEQKVCPEDQWPAFMAALKENLPTAFRITGSKCEADALMNIVKSEYFSQLLNVKMEVDGKEGEEIKPFNLPWYPGGLAWQLRLSRTDIRRSEPLYKLHNFLVAETAAGGVSRQETVSMIPPVVLDVKPHHKAIQEQMVAHGAEPVNFDDVKDEIFDMIRPEHPSRITLQDLIKSGHGHTAVSILLELHGFWAYENREALAAAGDHTT